MATVYRIKVLGQDGQTHSLPQVSSRDEAVQDAETARGFSWAKRVMVFKSSDRYGDEAVQVAEMAAKVAPPFPEQIPFETGATPPETD